MTAGGIRDRKSPGLTRQPKTSEPQAPIRDLVSKHKVDWAGDGLARWLSGTAPSGDLSSVPSTHARQVMSNSNPAPQSADALWPPRVSALMCVRTTRKKRWKEPKKQH